MSPILGIWASQISGNLWQPAGAYDALATVTVPSGGAASITFAGIPAGYKHLQIRFIARGTAATGGGNFIGIRYNSDSSTSYAYHQLEGNGSSATAAGGGNQTTNYLQRMPNSSNTASAFGAGVVDILDYSSTTKYKTMRELGGFDLNGGGSVFLVSGLWFNGTISAINSITLTPEVGNFAEYSSFALYGVK
jgi:hypothetical protein